VSVSCCRVRACPFTLRSTRSALYTRRINSQAKWRGDGSTGSKCPPPNARDLGHPVDTRDVEHLSAKGSVTTKRASEDGDEEGSIECLALSRRLLVWCAGVRRPSSPPWHWLQVQGWRRHLEPKVQGDRGRVGRRRRQRRAVHRAPGPTLRHVRRTRNVT
jgi:hypothetical protein